MILRCVGEEGEQIWDWFQLNEFKTNYLQDNVYTALHVGPLSNGAQSNEVIKLVDDDGGPCSIEVTQY